MERSPEVTAGLDSNLCFSEEIIWPTLATGTLQDF